MKFTLVLDDASGNSFIENPQAPEKDPLMTVVYYARSPDQDVALGLQPSSEDVQQEEEEEEEEEDDTGM